VGIVKSVTIPVSELATALDQGIWFDGSSVEGFARIAESDMLPGAGPRHYAAIPWQQDGGATARLICDVYTPAGEPFEGDPRRILKRAMQEVAALGFVYKYRAGA